MASITYYMMSVIICSRCTELAQKIKKNVAETIGIPYEILIIDNSVQNKSITSVYNHGVSLAKYDLLCFVHEDVTFVTVDWGNKICNHLSDPETGLIGLAGGDAFSSVPSTWSNACLSVEMNILQWTNSSSTNPEHLFRSHSPEPRLRSEVAVLDGVFICCRKEIFTKIRFDDVLLKGFHGYDMDISLQSGRYYKNEVIFDLLLEHLSEGKLSKDWMDSTFLVAKKWQQSLPLYICKVNKIQQLQYHWQTLHVLITNLFNLSYPADFIYYSCLKYAFGRFFSLRKFLSMNKHFWLEYRSHKKEFQQNRSLIPTQLA